MRRTWSSRSWPSRCLVRVLASQAPIFTSASCVAGECGWVGAVCEVGAEQVVFTVPVGALGQAPVGARAVRASARAASSVFLAARWPCVQVVGGGQAARQAASCLSQIVPRASKVGDPVGFEAVGGAGVAHGGDQGAPAPPIRIGHPG
jgi:hypothetical protein